MGSSGDFVELLGQDMSMKIFMCLDDLSDLARATAVSSSWRRVVIENRLCKQLCLRIYPELSKVVGVIELSDKPEMVESRLHNLRIPEMFGRDHKAYSFLACGLMSFAKEDCIAVAISASSTDNYPDESIENTMEANDRSEGRATYWSSRGESDPAVPEALVYKLITNLCLISEIHIQPFQAYFQFGFPIYSAKAVRFRMGHLNSPLELGRTAESSGQRFADDMFIWTYTSPEFPMDQAANSQNFQLPKPVLCIGGVLKIELLGRVQKQELDGLYYMCVSHVQVVGRPLGPSFDIDILDQSGRCTLKYYPEAHYCLSNENREVAESSMSQSVTLPLLHRRVGTWEHLILNALLGNAVIPDSDDSEDDELVA